MSNFTRGERAKRWSALAKRASENPNNEDLTKLLEETLPLRTALARKCVAKYGLPPCDIDDVMQDVAVRLCANTNYNGRNKVSTWLGALTRYAVLDRLEKRKRCVVVYRSSDAEDVESHEGIAPEPDPEQVAIVVNLLDYARCSAAADFRMMVAQVKGYTAAEMAPYGGGSAQAVHKRWSRARESLSHLLQYAS